MDSQYHVLQDCPAQYHAYWYEELLQKRTSTAWISNYTSRYSWDAITYPGCRCLLLAYTLLVALPSPPLKTESCHAANFAVVMTTSVDTSDIKVGTITTLCIHSRVFQLVVVASNVISIFSENFDKETAVDIYNGFGYTDEYCDYTVPHDIVFHTALQG